ncbi:MAG: aspartate carbamoyltransferase catalytic subunit [Candidatus Eiseniibacteriota bacterium]
MTPPPGVAVESRDPGSTGAPGVLPAGPGARPGPERRDLLDLETLPVPTLVRLLEGARAFQRVLNSAERKRPVLAGTAVANVFFEASTRTRVSFEWAEKRVGADSVSFSTQGSSVSKGETLLDTVWTLESMGLDLIVVRHASAGVPHFLARHVSARVINAGDGAHEHPTQGLLDARTLLDAWGSLEGRRIAIVGDIAHSRVARSAIWAFTKLGASVVLCGPASLLPAAAGEGAFGGPEARVSATTELAEAVEGADAVMALRLQTERMERSVLPSNADFVRRYRLTQKRLAAAKPDVLVMHPGPMNRSVEIASHVADSPRSVIRAQVTNGVAVRMAVLCWCRGLDPVEASS